MAYNPKNPGGKNSPESMALFQGYSAEAFKAAKGMDISANTLDTLSKNAEMLTEAARRKIVLSNSNIKLMAKSIAQMSVAAQSLRTNPKDIANIVSLSRSMTNVARFRKILSASGVGMPQALSRADFSARGNISQISQGRPIAPVLDKMLAEAVKERKLKEKEVSGDGYGSHLHKLFAKNVGKSGFMANMASGGLAGMQGIAGRAVMSMGPAGIALGAAAMTAGAIVMGISKLQDLQKSLVEKAQPYTDYLSNVAQVSRYGGQGGVMNMPFEMKNIAGTSTTFGNLSNLLPQFSTTNGMSPAAMQALAATGVPVRNLDEGAKVLRTIYGMQAGGPFGGMDTGQLTGITKQLYGFGFASRNGGNMVNTQAGSVAHNIYGTSLELAFSEGFDKSQVAQAIQDSLEAMAKNGGINATMPSGLMSLFAGFRGMTPGVAGPSSVLSSVQGLSEAGAGILSKPGLMVGLQNYVSGHYKGNNLSEKIMAMGKNNPQIRAFTSRYSKAIKESPSFALEAMAEAGLLTNILPASLNGMFGGGKGTTGDLIRAHAMKGTLNQSFSQGLGLSNVHTAISGGAGGLDDHTREMLRLHGMMQTQPWLQSLSKMSPQQQASWIATHQGDPRVRSFFSSQVFGGPAGSANPLMGALTSTTMTSPAAPGNPRFGIRGHAATYATDLTNRGAAFSRILGDIGATNRRNASMMADAAQSNLSVEEQRGQAGIVTTADLAAAQSQIAGAQGLDAATAQNWLTATKPMVDVLRQINSGIQALVRKTQ